MPIKDLDILRFRARSARPFEHSTGHVRGAGGVTMIHGARSARCHERRALCLPSSRHLLGPVSLSLDVTDETTKAQSLR